MSEVPETILATFTAWAEERVARNTATEEADRG